MHRRHQGLRGGWCVCAWCETGARRSPSAPPAERRSGELSDDSYHLALDLDLAGEYRLHLTVRRLEADALLLSEEALERHAVVLEERDDDVSVPAGALR